MILGLGTDIVEVERIRDSVARYGSRFLARVFTKAEQAYCGRKRCPEQSLAARFAAKEAAAKALGTGIARGAGWQDFEVTREPGRAPQLQLHGRAQALAAELGVARVHLSLTHSEQYAAAVVLFEAPAAAMQYRVG